MVDKFIFSLASKNYQREPKGDVFVAQQSFGKLGLLLDQEKKTTVVIHAIPTYVASLYLH